MANSPTYNEISRLTTTLTSSTNITSQRAAASKLLSKLADAKIRSRLASESASSAASSGTASNCGYYDPNKALRQIYRVAIRAAVFSSGKTLHGKSKCKLEDVILPLKILQHIDSDSDAIQKSISSSQDHFYQDEPFTYDSFNRYRNTNSTKTHLGPSEIQSLLKYCLECLDNEDAKAVAEVDLMNMLCRLCSRGDYVCHFHSRADLGYILSQIHPRLLGIDDDEHDGESGSNHKRSTSNVHKGRKRGGSIADNLMLHTARTFANLVHQCIVTLGTQIMPFVGPCISLVTEWVRKCEADAVDKGKVLQTLQYVYGVMVDLMAAYPEQCIIILGKDGCGRDLWGYARRYWNNARDAIRNVLVEYFSAHLLVCEVAGKIQGLFPGDLGDVGSASLDGTKLNFLLQIVMSERAIDTYANISKSSQKSKKVAMITKPRHKNAMASNKRRRRIKSNINGTGEDVSVITPLVKRDRRYLELCARLLRCAQRKFLVESEIKAIEDADDPSDSFMNDDQDHQSKKNNGLGTAMSDISMEKVYGKIGRCCPWVQFVARFVNMDCVTVASPASTAVGTMSSSPAISVSMSPVSPATSTSIIASKQIATADSFCNTNKLPSVSNSSSLVAYLQIISACAEVFPRGECWSSTNRWKRTNFCPLENNLEGSGDENSLSYCNVCTLKDLSSVVRSVSYLLERHGGASGDQTVQMWALIALLKLTESSTIVWRYWEDDDIHHLSAKELGLAWQAVWKILFRSDFRYSSYTAKPLPSSHGELVLMLLTEIIRCCCVDPAQLNEYPIEENSLLVNDNTSSTLSPGSANNLLASFIALHQEQVWNLPVFKDAFGVKISAPFELATIMIQRVGLSEDGSDAMGTQFFTNRHWQDGTPRKRIEMEALEGSGRRHRIACFCLRFIENAVLSDQAELIRCTIPFVSACFGTLLGESDIIPITTFSMSAFRQLRCTEENISSFEFNISRNPTSPMPISLQFSVLWEDSILPFGGQYHIENSEKLWRALQGRDLPLCPLWSKEDRIWLKKKLGVMSKRTLDFIAYPDAKRLRDFGLIAVNHFIRTVSHSGTQEKLSLTCKTSLVKFIIVLALSGERELQSDIPWNVVEEIIQPIIKEASVSLKAIALNSDQFSFVVSDLLGIVRAVKECYITRKIKSISRLFEKNTISTLSNECMRLINLHVAARDVLSIHVSFGLESGNRKLEREQLDASDDEFEDTANEHNSNMLSIESPESDNDEMDSDDFSSKKKRKDPNRTPQQRKRSRNYGSMRRMLTYDNSENSAPDSKGAWLCASILILLEPSIHKCKIITDALVWPCEVCDSIDWGCVIFDTCEPHDSLLCLSLLCPFATALEIVQCHKSEGESEELSIFSLCTQVISKGRSQADLSSPFHVFGFEACSILVSVHARGGPSRSLEKIECEDLFAVLDPEGTKMGPKDELSRYRRSLKNRPHLRSLQIQAAVKCFLDGDKQLHQLFDTKFAVDFVIPSLSNGSAMVRWAAIQAIGAALTLLPFQQQIFDDALEALAPFPTTGEDQKVTSDFKLWINSKFNTSSNDMIEMEHKAMKESRLCLESDTILCLGIIGGSTSDDEIANKIIMKMVGFSAKMPKLQALCFRSLEYIALKRSFRSLEDMFRAGREWMLRYWMSSGRKISSIPMGLCSPGLFRSILRVGRAWDILGLPFARELSCQLEYAAEGTGKATDIDQLRDDATDDYISQSASTMIPLILMLPPEDLDEKNAQSNKRKEKRDETDKRRQYLEEASNALTRGLNTDGRIGIVLRSHLHDIYAFVFPLIQDSCDEACQLMGSNALEYLSENLSKDIIEKEGVKNAHIVIRELLRLSGKDMVYYNSVKLGKDAYTKAIRYAAARLSYRKKSSNSACIFEDAGTSTTECLLHARLWLDQSLYFREKKHAWMSLTLLFDEVLMQACSQDSKNTQLGFCLKNLLDILVDKRHVSIRLSVLSMLRRIISAVTTEETIEHNKNDISSVLNKMCTTLIQIHEEFQREFIHSSLTTWQEERRKAYLKCPLRSMLTGESSFSLETKNEGSDQSPLEVALQAQDQDSYDTKPMFATYDMLNMILIEKSHLLRDIFQTLDPFPQSSIPTDQAEILFQYKNKFSLRTIIQDFEESQDSFTKRDIILEIEIFLKMSRKLRLNLTSTSQSTGILKSEIINRPRFSKNEPPLQSDVRSHVSALEQLRFRLRNDFGDLVQDVSSRGKRTLYALLHELFLLSASQYPDAVHLAASRCIGELACRVDVSDFSIADISTNGHNASFISNTDNITSFFENPLMQMYSKALDLLTAFLQSNDVETAIVAKDTLKALLLTKEGLHWWENLKDDSATKSAVTPLMKKKKLSRSDIPKLSDDFLDSLLSFAGKTASSAENDKNWCWDDKIWNCPEGDGFSFEDWIKKVVCSILICCYADVNSKSKCTARQMASQGITGSGNFLPLCIKMCALEYHFAVAVFPVIIFDLLSSDEVDDDNISYETIKKRGDYSLLDGSIGAPFSLTNITLTRCFTNILGYSAEYDESFLTSTDRVPRSDPQAVKTILIVLDMLRCITQHQFATSSHHKRNKRKLDNRTYPSHERMKTGTSKPLPKRLQTNYNADIDPSPTWRGVPYGVVLHLNGVELAKSFLDSRYIASAMYYAEMYADNRLGGSGCVLERMAAARLASSTEKSSDQYSVSGFGLPIKSHSPISSRILELSDNELGRALIFQRLLSRCCKELHEMDCVKALEAQGSAIRFRHTSRTGQNLNTLNDGIMAISDCSQSLVNLDTHMQVNSVSNLPSSQGSLAIANCLGTLGLRHVLRTYISGLWNQVSDPIDSEGENLREKWAEETWRILQWDDSLLPKTPSTTATFASNPEWDTMKRDAISQKFGAPFCEPISNFSVASKTKTGFHESMNKTFLSLLKDDNSSFVDNLLVARKCLSEQVNNFVGLESVLAGVSEFALKFNALNEIEDVGSVVFGQMPARDLLNKWRTASDSINDLDSDGYQALKYSEMSFPFKSVEFAMSSREVALRIICQKYGAKGNSDAGQALSSHLWELCSIARRHGRPNVADAALQRLRNFIDTCLFGEDDEYTRFETSVRLSLEEARIKDCAGDTTSAIRRLKLIIESVHQFRSQTNEDNTNGINLLLGKCLLQCGKWLIDHRIDSAITVLNDYLRPAAELSQNILREKRTLSASHLFSSSNFILGEFVSNLYDSMEKRVQSHEWKIAGIAAEERCKELAQCEKLAQDAKSKFKKAYSKVKRNSSEAIVKAAENLQRECKGVTSHYLTLQKEVEMDAKERNSVEKSVSEYLKLAIKSFGIALSNCDNNSDYSKYAFRMVSMWFRNCHKTEKNCNINLLVEELADKIPSFHFVPLIYQLFSRIDVASEVRSTEYFQSALQKIVKRICIDHPYHGLVQLIALSNGNNVGTGVGGMQARTYLDNVGDSKVEATKNLLQSIKKNGPSWVSDLAESYKFVTDAYIALAMAPTDDLVKMNKRDLKLSLVNKGRNGRSLDCVLRGSYTCRPCVLTSPPHLRPGCDYGNGVEDPIGSERIASFDSNFSLTDSGIHRPKIIICRGTQGTKFKQLVKGEDDIRQDAIMQQVFLTVNKLLRRQGEAKNGPSQLYHESSVRESSATRQLNIVTYNCIPLSPASGVLEWVDNTIPFGDYLADHGESVGAHSKYYPGEWGSNLCRVHLTDSPIDKKRAAFDEICKHFSPAFRFFFLERFSHSSQAWHEARMSYVRSCAVSSIVGHILGIGDRHAQNILVHEKTGEVVHIDFGIVFEQGKLLQIPETVPFRLTRDIVDGMGPTGTEGTFTVAAEATTKVLRGNSSDLLTILSAVVSDPLYKWCVSPITVHQHQRDEADGSDNQYNRNEMRNFPSNNSDSDAIMAENENDAASRAIAKINEKLQGYEEGTLGERQTVEGQVRLLINAAREPSNLSLLFPGWSPWL